MKGVSKIAFFVLSLKRAILLYEGVLKIHKTVHPRKVKNENVKTPCYVVV